VVRRGLDGTGNSRDHWWSYQHIYRLSVVKKSGMVEGQKEASIKEIVDSAEDK
jgi:hypothetical protein